MDYDDFLRHICPMLDLNWRKYRRRAARRGVQARIRELGLPGYAAYLDVLIADSAEARALPDRMLVTVSRFFRERDRWRILSERVLPVLACEAQRAGPSGIGAGFPGKDAQALVKAWSVGACGGEEPYTLSMVWLSWEAGGRQDAAVDILATDIDPDSLERARTADYQGSSLREVPSAARDRWFRQIGPDSWHVTEAARRPVRFWRHHLLDDLPPPASDLILCRYLAFTYFIGDRRRRAVERLAAASRPGGALMVGAKEDPGGSLEGLFPTVARGAWGVSEALNDRGGPAACGFVSGKDADKSELLCALEGELETFPSQTHRGELLWRCGRRRLRFQELGAGGPLGDRS